MKHKVLRTVAAEVAEEIVHTLEPFCERIKIAGSIRREKSEVGDIEVLMIPRYESRRVSLFGDKDFDIAAEKINQMLTAGVLAKRPNVRGHFAWGPLNKLAIHTASGIGVDFFTTTAAHWYVSLVIRTGPAEFNQKLMTSAARHGINLHAYGDGTGATETHGGNDIPVTSERHVFELAGMPWKEPKDR